MTTVAFDGKIIACDSQVSGGMGDNMYKETATKGRVISTVAGPALVIGVGLVSDFEEALGFIEQGKNPKLTQDESEILMVKDGAVYRIAPESSSQAGKPSARVPARARKVSHPYAWGSGEVYAFTVLRLGGTAGQAVAASCVIDLYSSGTIHAWDVETLRPVKVSQKAPTIK